MKRGCQLEKGNYYKKLPCIITIETVMCIMNCRKYHMHNYNRNSHLHNQNKIFTHIFAAAAYVLQNLLTAQLHQNSHLLNCNRKIHQHTSNKKYHLKTCIDATDVITCIIAIESVSCIVPAETSTCRIDYRIFHLQKWCLSEIHLVTIKK